jgi:hypothetical protein
MGGRLASVARTWARVIASPSYFPLWLGQLISNFGDTLHYITLVVLVFQLTGRGLAVAGWWPPRLSRSWCSGRSPA